MKRCSNLTRFSIPCLMLIGSAAMAQPSTTEPAPTTAAPSAQPGGEATPTLQAAAPPLEPAHEPMVRIRAGAGGAPSVFYPGVSYGAGFSGRIGVQLKKMWGVYADVGGGFGLGGSISAGTGGGGVSINVADYWRLAAMGEVDLGRYFFVALGAGVCGCTWGGVQQVATAQGAASQAAYVSDGYDPALVSRIGVGFGKGRNKFTLALENMVAFGKMTQVSQNASMAGADQSVKIGNLAVGWTPGIFLGWDMR